jgi:hypothetical protein
MKHPNIYTFKHSALPPMTDEIEAEIAEIDSAVENLLVKYQGHYRALNELQGTLSDLLDSCEFNLHCIRIVPEKDCEKDAARGINLNDLPAHEKTGIVFEIVKGRAAINLLAQARGCSTKEALHMVENVAIPEFAHNLALV